MHHKGVFNFSAFLNLIRVLFPKWSFFDQVDTSVIVEAKPQGGQSWVSLSSENKPAVGALIYNAETNLSHAYENILREFLRDLQPYLAGEGSLAQDDLARMISFRQVTEWTRQKLEAFEVSSGRSGFLFQFRLKSADGEIFFVSHEIHSQTPSGSEFRGDAR